MKSGGFVLIRPTHSFHIDKDESSLLWSVMQSDISMLENITTSGKRRSYLLAKLIEYIGIHHDTQYKIRSLEYMQEIF